MMESKYEINQPVKLAWTDELLDDEDFGLSGMVLESPFKEFKHILNDTFHYGGTLMENPEWCILEARDMRGDTRRIYWMQVTLIKPHPDYEKVGHTWTTKNIPF